MKTISVHLELGIFKYVYIKFYKLGGVFGMQRNVEVHGGRNLVRCFST